MKKLLVAALVLTVSACAPLQSLQGVVRDKDTGSPISSAHVKVNRDTASTDAMGYYRVSGAFRPGDTIMINAPGYNIYTKSVRSVNEIADFDLTRLD